MRKQNLARWLFAAMCVAGTVVGIYAEDWPEFRGEGRLGIWRETGVLQTFPGDGLKVRWRTPIKAGYAGPAVVDGRVFVTDWQPTSGMQGIERALALDEATGDRLWTQAWDADYAGISWEIGPGATPTVDDDRVYMLGRTGVLSAFAVDTGRFSGGRTTAKTTAWTACNGVSTGDSRAPPSSTAIASSALSADRMMHVWSPLTS